jgi:hypothetical protein
MYARKRVIRCEQEWRNYNDLSSGKDFTVSRNLTKPFLMTSWMSNLSHVECICREMGSVTVFLGEPDFSVVERHNVCRWLHFEKAWNSTWPVTAQWGALWKALYLEDDPIPTCRRQWRQGEILTGAINHSRGVLRGSYKKSLACGVPQKLFCMAKMRY